MKLPLLPVTVAALGFATLLFTGCSTVNTVAPAQTVNQPQMMPDKRVITDSSLNRHVRIIGVNSTDTPAGFLKIQIQVQNVTSSLQSFTYRIEWFDQTGMVITLPTDTAISHSLEGKETFEIVAIAPTTTAKDFRVKFLQPAN
jgi:uncharacterized protein YcfL